MAYLIPAVQKMKIDLSVIQLVTKKGGGEGGAESWSLNCTALQWL